MPVRTQAELQQQINTLLLDNTTGEISAADVRSVLTDVADSLAFTASISAIVQSLVADPAETGNTDRWALAKLHADVVHSITLTGTEITVERADGTHYTIHLPASGGTGLAAVSRDNTLTGDGTSVNPLSVARPVPAEGVLNGATFDSTTYMAALTRTLGTAVALDLSPILTRIEAIEARFGPAPDHSAYLGWKSTRNITVADFPGATESDNHRWTVPDGGPGYLWYAVTTDDGAPSHELVNGFRQPSNAFTQVGQAIFMGTTYLLFATAAQLAETAEGQSFELQY